MRVSCPEAARSSSAFLVHTFLWPSVWSLCSSCPELWLVQISTLPICLGCQHPGGLPFAASLCLPH